MLVLSASGSLDFSGEAGRQNASPLGTRSLRQGTTRQLPLGSMSRHRLRQKVGETGSDQGLELER